MMASDSRFWYSSSPFFPTSADRLVLGGFPMVSLVVILDKYRFCRADAVSWCHLGRWIQLTRFSSYFVLLWSLTWYCRDRMAWSRYRITGHLGAYFLACLCSHAATNLKLVCRQFIVRHLATLCLEEYLWSFRHRYSQQWAPFALSR